MRLDKMKYIFFVAIAFFCCSINAENKIHFSCLISKGEVKLQESHDSLIYSISKNGKETFKFESKGSTFPLFSYNHYSRYQTNYLKISFLNQEYKYSIFSNYENGEEKKGVVVLNSKNNKEYIYYCLKPGVDKLYHISKKLSCDKEDALGC